MFSEIIAQFGKDSFGGVVPWNVHLYPLLGILLYRAYPTTWRIDTKLLHTLTLIHNAFLVLFSFGTFVSLAELLVRKGVVFDHGYYFGEDGNLFSNIILFFYLSKYYEFFDTFLLYLQSKQPIFLQKFHHVGAVIVWHLCYVYKVDAIWISTLVNSFVHTIMYTYYLGCILKIKQVRLFKQYITTLQLIQLCVPAIVALWKYIPPVETPFNYGIIVFFCTYVAGLVHLFLEFYMLSYMQSGNKKKNKGHATEGSGDVENIKEIKTD